MVGLEHQLIFYVMLHFSALKNNFLEKFFGHLKCFFGQICRVISVNVCLNTICI